MYPPRLPLPFGLKIPIAMFEKGQSAGTRDSGVGGRSSVKSWATQARNTVGKG